MMAKFNVGDKVRATTSGWVSINTLGEVTAYDGTDHMPYAVDIGEGGFWLNEDEFELVVEKPKKSERITALETQVAEQRDELVALQAKVEALEATVKYPNTARFERESAEVDGILADIKRKAKPTLEALLATYPTPNEQRADVIKRAKAFVTKWTKRAANVKMEDGNSRLMNRGSLTTEFIVNAEKRTVVCLAKSHTFFSLRAKGIAKCDPDDVFNADIGKAIALARALGVEVPTEFVKAVQPTEVIVGQRIRYTSKYPNLLVTAKPSKGVSDGISIGLASQFSRSNRILDDTDAVYE